MQLGKPIFAKERNWGPPPHMEKRNILAPKIFWEKSKQIGHR